MAIEGAELQISVEEGERWRRTMNVIVPSGVVNSERRRLTGELAARVKLPGFRKGHVPSSVVEKRFGQSWRREARDKLIGAAYREALSQQELNPISEGEVGNVQYEPDCDSRFPSTYVRKSSSRGSAGLRLNGPRSTAWRTNSSRFWDGSGRRKGPGTRWRKASQKTAIWSRWRSSG